MRKGRRNISLNITNYANRKCFIRVNKNTIVQQENFNDYSIASLDRSKMKKKLFSLQILMLSARLAESSVRSDNIMS